MAPEDGNFADVMSAVREATAAMVARREEADEKARAAIEAVEKKLVAVLDGESLRGLPDLGDRVYGLRVGAEGAAYARLPPDGRNVLVLDRHGLLVVAAMHGNGSAFFQRAPRALVRASVLVPYIRAVRTALGLHLRSASDREREFSDIAALAGRIATVVA